MGRPLSFMKVVVKNTYTVFGKRELEPLKIILVKFTYPCQRPKISSLSIQLFSLELALFTQTIKKN